MSQYQEVRMSDNQEYNQLRVMLERIDTILSHQTALLEEFKAESKTALETAKESKNEARQAKWKADFVMKELDKYKKEQKNKKRTLVTTIVAVGGIVVTIVIFLTPIVISYYIE